MNAEDKLPIESRNPTISAWVEACSEELREAVFAYFKAKDTELSLLGSAMYTGVLRMNLSPEQL